MTDKPNTMLGFLSKVGLVSVREDEAPPAVVVRGAPASSPPGPAFAASAPLNAAVADPAVLERLEHRLQTNCPPAYAAFMEQYTALGDVISDEGTRFRAALKTSHTTVAQIVSALDLLLGAMETARGEFQKNYDENKARKMGDAEASVKATDDLIAQNERQLQSLQETIVSLRTKREADVQAMQEATRKIEGVKRSFELAHAMVVARLEGQKARVGAAPGA